MEFDIEDNYGGPTDDFEDVMGTLGGGAISSGLAIPASVIEEASVSNARVTANALSMPVEDLELEPVTVKNIVASGMSTVELDLRQITISTRNIEYNPRRHNAATLRLISPNITVLIFGNGRLAALGAKTVENARYAVKVAAKICQKTGHPDLRLTNFKVESLVCSADCKFPVRLENLAQDHAPYCNYEPETFCGLVYRYNPAEDKKATVLVFVSGKMVISGCKTEEAATEVFYNLYPVLYQYRS